MHPLTVTAMLAVSYIPVFFLGSNAHPAELHRRSFVEQQPQSRSSISSIVPTFFVVFTNEGETFPTAAGTLANTIDNGALCVDVPTNWTQVTITAENVEQPTVIQQITKCDAKLVYSFKEKCMSPEQTPAKERGTAISKPEGEKTKGKDIDGGIQSIGLVCGS